MTIAISTKIGEGLVYAADSTSSYFETFPTADGPQSRLVQSFHHARKLIQLRDYPVGILTFGLGQIGTRNLESLVTEFERSLPPHETASPYTVEELARGLQAFVKDKYDEAHPPPPPSLPDSPPAPDPRAIGGLGMGIVVGGFSSDAYHADEWLLTFPDGAVTPVDAGFGARWWGSTGPLSRLVLGIDPGATAWMASQGLEQAEAEGAVRELTKAFQWSIYFDGMPVQDAIDLVVFLANVAIGHSRFVAGPPICGGPIDVAIITHRGFTWIKRKHATVKNDSIFF